MTFNKDKEPGAYVDLNVNNLSQRFNSGISKNTNWFVADGELSQRDEKLSQKRRSMLGHKNTWRNPIISECMCYDQ